MFKVTKQSKKSPARCGEFKTRRGIVHTPCFMPIATKAAVKFLTYEDLELLQPEVVLSNTYHMMVRPGEKLVAEAGDLHGFMHWKGPMLTDSGGFQVFSLDSFRKMSEEGVKFRSPIDGKAFFMAPEDSIRIQLALGADIIMVLDECVALPAKPEYLAKSVELTTRWAARCKKYFDAKTKKLPKNKRPLLFGIVQGGLDKKLREKSAAALQAIGFDGYAVGGVAVGEATKDMMKVLDWALPTLPLDQPRYVMGIGRPENIIEAVRRGADMFDCVIPTREARHGRMYFWNPRVKNVFTNPTKCYTPVNIRAQKYAHDFSVINPKSRFGVLRNYTKAYVRHLFSVDEPLAQRLTTLHNLEFYLDLMARIKKEM